MKLKNVLLITLLVSSSLSLNLKGAANNSEQQSCTSTTRTSQAADMAQIPPYNFTEYDDPDTVLIPQAAPESNQVQVGESLVSSCNFVLVSHIDQENKASLLLRKTLGMLNPDQTIQGLPPTIIINNLVQHLIVCGGALMHNITTNAPITINPKNAHPLYVQQPDYIGCQPIIELQQRLTELTDSTTQHVAQTSSELEEVKLALNEKYNAYLRDIIALSWYLYSESINKKSPFADGSFIILDEDYKIYNFLMFYVRLRNNEVTCAFSTDQALRGSTNVFAYPRASTHFREEQVQDDTLNRRHYGIDIRLDEKEATLDLLPTGKKHILFGLVGQTQVSDSSNQVKNVPLLFIKFEDEGIAIGSGSFTETARKKLEWLGHVGGAIASTGRKLEKKFSNGSLLRACTVATFGSDDSPTSKKERTPVTFCDECNKLLANTSSAASDLKTFDTRGIKELASRVAHKPSHWTSELHSAFIQYFEQLCREYDYITIRTGNEIILGKEELKSRFFYHYMARAIAAKENPVLRKTLCKLAYTSELIYNDLSRLKSCQQNMDNTLACITRIKTYPHLRQTRAHFDEEMTSFERTTQTVEKLKLSLARLEEHMTTLKSQIDE